MILAIFIVVVGSTYLFMGVVWLMLQNRLPEEEAEQYRMPVYDQESS